MRRLTAFQLGRVQAVLCYFRYHDLGRGHVPWDADVRIRTFAWASAPTGAVIITDSPGDWRVGWRRKKRLYQSVYGSLLDRRGTEMPPHLPRGARKCAIQAHLPEKSGLPQFCPLMTFVLTRAIPGPFPGSPIFFCGGWHELCSPVYQHGRLLLTANLNQGGRVYHEGLP